MSAQNLYQLLPAIHRMRDAQSGHTLEALLAIVQGQADRLADDLDDLEDDWFIETCRDWVVPYLGELVSARDHYAFGEGSLSLRAFVANTLNFRRRKGTASMLEDLALAVTGWPCHAVEMFQRVATTQHVNHVRPGARATISLRSAAALERLEGPFDASYRLVDVRNPDGNRARPNVPNVNLFLWRVSALEAVSTVAVADTAAGPGRFRFDPLGSDRRIFGPARTLDDLALDVTEPDVPGPARRRPLFDELTAAREAIAAGTTPHYRYFPAGQEIVTLTPVGETAPIPPEQIQICNLDNWATLPTPITVTRPDATTFTTRAAVDPQTGRIAFLGLAPTAVRVTYHYGAAAAIGAGHDPREHATARDVAVSVANWSLAQAPDLATAITAWVGAGRPSRIIEVTDSGRYAAPPAITVPAGRRLTLRARGGQRPVVVLGASWPITLEAGATLVIDGLLLAGGTVAVRTQAAGGATANLELRHATIVPGLGQTRAGAPSSPGAVVLQSDAASTGALRVVIDHTIVGRTDVTSGVAGFVSDVHISDSVVDDASDPAEALRAHDLTIARCTLLGPVVARTLEATDAIFTHAVAVERTQEGCVRFCYLPSASKVPRTYRCVNGPRPPSFTSTRFGDGGYMQLVSSCPEAIRAGGSDGSEMGVHFHLHQPQREANLRRGLDEYLRFGLVAGLVFVT